ncbi:MAG: nuclear transport factor 2 family protein [Myxococcota bacterium]
MADDELEILRAERAITRVILDYARGVDALDLERIRGCFHPDARIHYGEIFSGPRDEAIAWLENSLSRLQGTMHDFGAPWIELDLARGRAECETYATNAARYPANERGEVVLNVTGTRYIDTFERRDGAWRILERRNVSSWAHNSIETPTPPPPFKLGGPRQR